ncbi:GNAT family N-acetyltransferase [Pseudoalteromonas denitrificans]|jgi:predicted GNAT family N-acyltransferase|uniref:Acetyltransferase (GNAT) domain-containing protein n=1 Tax=Pseudoalteromonas denitrificans DSM 6059 TaxID=1123010 RepID=A0A1I1EWY9_9GAMM|nr:GNAT family N-acetyltransferase [Pseudoalteromonas denitrificans]SFB90008.1 Acetyltransferase (GNAT) domain-containing protein [Pseudoalteromonas denitrificans DSM 6059]
MKIRTIQWDETLPVRHTVLWPNKPASFCKVEGDEKANHYGVYLNNKLVSVASVYINGCIARLRKFATLMEFQGKGLGTKLIAYILDEMKITGIKCFWCDARKTAVGFYKKFGMEQQGTEFYKSGIPYFKMELQLDKPITS